MMKFRTMRHESERFGTTTAEGDPRITPLGSVLRRFKIDELAQLYNVLKGEMSLVGPRPEVREHTDAYDEEEQAILHVVPGITDFSSLYFSNLGDVLGRTNAHEVFVTQIRPKKNALRLKYVRERGFMTDAKILARTLAKLILRQKTIRP